MVYNIEEVLLTLEDNNIHELKMYHEWPVREPRPVKSEKKSKYHITGQRV